jgi:hypothetical protein
MKNFLIFSAIAIPANILTGLLFGYDVQGTMDKCMGVVFGAAMYILFLRIWLDEKE